MKKLVLSTLAVLALMLTTQMNAQSDKGLFFSVNGGYNFSSASQNLSSNSTRTSNSSSSSTVRTEALIEGSYGKGFNFGGAVGYMFNKNIGAELGINYLVGGEITGSRVENNSGASFSDNYISEGKSSAKMLQFRPTIILSAGLDKINPYAKFGILIGSGSIEQSTNGTSKSINSFGGSTITNSSTSDSTFKADGGTAIGFHSALGLSLNVNKNMSIFVELNMVNMSYAPTKGTQTSYNVNGVDQLSSLTISSTQLEFVDSTNSSDVQLPTNPTKVLKENYAFSSFGINFGLKYSL